MAGSIELYIFSEFEAVQIEIECKPKKEVFFSFFMFDQIFQQFSI